MDPVTPAELGKNLFLITQHLLVGQKEFAYPNENPSRPGEYKIPPGAKIRRPFATAILLFAEPGDGFVLLYWVDARLREPLPGYL